MISSWLELDALVERPAREAVERAAEVVRVELDGAFSGRVARKIAGEHRAGRHAEADPDALGVTAAQLLGCARRHDPTGGHHGDAIGEVLRLVHVVRRQKDGLTEGGEVPHDLPRLPSGGRVEAGRRFVEEEQVRVAGEGDGDVEAALLAARELQDPGVALLAQADETDDLADRAGVWVVAGVHPDRLGDGEVAVDAGRLEHDTDPGLQLLALAVRGRGRGPATRPPSRCRYPSRISTVVVLPAPFGPRRAKISPVAILEIQSGHGGDVGVGLRETGDLDGHRSRGPRRADSPHGWGETPGRGEARCTG